MTIYEKQLLASKIYAIKNKRKYKLDFAIEGIKKMLEIAPNSYVSISWGKQSICIADMIYKIRKDIPMFFLASEETWKMYNFHEVINDFKEKHPGLNYKCIQTHRFENAKSWKEGRDSGDKDLQNMCDRKDWDGWFWGLAKEESNPRRITLSIQKNNNIHPTIFKYKDGKYRCCPIMNWDINDIGAYIQENNIEVLNVYKKFGLQMRTTARLTKKARDSGAMFYIRFINKHGYRELSEIHEEVSH